MSRSFRGLVLAVVLAWGLAPQLACFMPDKALTKSEMDCCEGMSGDCNSASMTDACCQSVVRTDVGIAARVARNLMPGFEVAERAVDISIALPHMQSYELSIHQNHAPPHEFLGSSVILRI
jgi:hypothetical protein